MSELVRFRLADGSPVLFETNTNAGVQLTSRLDKVTDAVASSLGDALSGVRKASVEVLEEFRDHLDGPEAVEIEFGVVLSAEAGAVIAKTGLEGHVRVKLTWKQAESQD